MSNQKVPPEKRKPATPPPRAARPAPPPRRPAPAAPRRAARQASSDRFGFYFIFVAVVGIFLFGAAVWGLRTVINASPAATPTVETIAAIPTFPAVETPLFLTPMATPTLAAPDAVNSGAFATTPPVDSIVTDTAHMASPAKLPAALPQPVVDLSATNFDLGSVGAAAVVTRELTLANAGAGDLVILRLATDCACLTARADAGKLHTGTRTHVTLTYDSSQDSAPSGAVTHKLLLATTDGQNPLTEVDVAATRP